MASDINNPLWKHTSDFPCIHQMECEIHDYDFGCIVYTFWENRVDTSFGWDLSRYRSTLGNIPSTLERVDCVAY